MPTYLTTAGDAVSYPEPTPAVAAFLAHAHAAAADPAVTVAEMTELVYGPENPVLDRTVNPARPMVTAAVFADPVFRVLSDLVGVKRIQAGHVDPSATTAAYTVTVAEAAEQLGITPGAVRAAISGRRLAGLFISGQWYTSPQAVASFRVSTRGRKPAGSGSGVQVRGGWTADASLHVSCRGLVLAGISSDPDAEMILTGELPADWTTALVTTAGSDNQLRSFEIERDPDTIDAAVRVGKLSVTGPFKVVEKHNSTKAALAAAGVWYDRMKRLKSIKELDVFTPLSVPGPLVGIESNRG